MNVRRLWILACTIAVALTVAACGSSNNPQTNKQSTVGQLSGHEVGSEINDGEYVEGGPITYQLQISRELNPYSVQDAHLIRGLPKGYPPPTADQFWYGVFMWAKNQHHHPYKTSDNFEIVDTTGAVYRPIDLNPQANPWAWTSQTLQYGETQPGEDSVQSDDEAQGGLLLFKLPYTVYSNRPLTLYILSPQGRKLSSISLDL